MEENCANCKKNLRLEILDYSKGGCKHTMVDNDFICLAFMDEGIACLMKGVGKYGLCEAFERKGG